MNKCTKLYQILLTIEKMVFPQRSGRLCIHFINMLVILYKDNSYYLLRDIYCVDITQ